MAGEVFEYRGDKYFYDESFIYEGESPFRFDNEELKGIWRYMDGKTLFNIVEPEPKTERRWRWRKDNQSGLTSLSGYMSDKYASKHGFNPDDWYKLEDDFLDVEIKDN